MSKHVVGAPTGDGASSNWKALRHALHPKADMPLSHRAMKRKRRRDESSSGDESRVNTVPADVHAHVHEGPAVSAAHEHAKKKGDKKKKRKEVPVKEIMEGGKESWMQSPGQYLAIDCEMVGIGPSGSESTLARVSIVNYHGVVILDRFVRPRETVTDYRTWVSGVREEDLRNAPTFSDVQKEVSTLIKDRVLIGHALSNDQQVLLLSHPWQMTRDTAKYAPLQTLARTKKPGLKTLAKLVLGLDIQRGEHSSVTDARATMAIYRSQKSVWEDSLRTRATPKLVTTSTPALAASATNMELAVKASSTNGRPTSLGLAATLQHARNEAEVVARNLKRSHATEEERDEKQDDEEEIELEIKEREKAQKEEVDDLYVGFDFEPAQKKRRKWKNTVTTRKKVALKRGLEES